MLATVARPPPPSMLSMRPLMPPNSDASANERKPKVSTAPDHMYQLMGLVQERGSGGVVDKFIITEEPVGRLIQTIAPGAFRSITSVCDSVS